MELRAGRSALIATRNWLRVRRAVTTGMAIATCAALLSGCGTSPGSALSRSVSRNGLTVSLSLSVNRVLAGGEIPATLTISNSTSKTLFFPSCFGDGTLQVGLSSRQIPFQPGSGLVGCGTNILSHHSLVQHEEVSAAYQGCGGPPQPLCLPGNPIPPLPAGHYVTAIDWQQVPTVVPHPESIAVTVLAQNPTRALLAQQALWPRRVKMGFLGGYWGPRRPGRLIPSTKLGANQDGSTCDATTCWSLALVGDQVFALRRADHGRAWRIGSPVITASSVSSWRRSIDTGSAPKLQLIGARTIVVMTPDNTFYLSPDAGTDWYVTSRFGSVVNFVSPHRGLRHRRAPFWLTAAAAPGSNAVRFYQSDDGVHWVTGPQGILPDLAGMDPTGVSTLLASLHLHGATRYFVYCGGAPVTWIWPIGAIWGQDPAPYQSVSAGTLVTVIVRRSGACKNAVP
jgi:hypothetical protein